MSRGPGHLQRLILAAVERGPVHALSLLGQGYTRSQRVALHRAVRAMESERRIAATRFKNRIGGCGHLVLHQPGRVVTGADRLALAHDKC